MNRVTAFRGNITLFFLLPEIRLKELRLPPVDIEVSTLGTQRRDFRKRLQETSKGSNSTSVDKLVKVLATPTMSGVGLQTLLDCFRHPLGRDPYSHTFSQAVRFSRFLASPEKHFVAWHLV